MQFHWLAASKSDNAGRSRATLALLILFSVAPFLPAMFNGPIEDDFALFDIRLRMVAHWKDLLPLLTESYWGDFHAGGLYRPLTLVVLGIYKLVFANPLVAGRVVSLALHTTCAVLIWRLAQTMLPAFAAFLCALIFAAHPIHAEAIITVYGQSDLWAATFALASLLLHLRGCREGRSLIYWLPIALLYLTGLGFKESIFPLPVAMAALRGMLVSSQTKGISRWISWRELLVAAAVIPYIALRAWVLGDHFLPGQETVVGYSAGIGGRITIAIVAIGTYLRLLVLPWGQTVYYGHLRDSLLAGGYLEAVAILVAAVIFAWTCNGGRWVAAGFAILALFLLPVSGLVPIGVLVAERCLYLPSVGSALLAGGYLTLGLRKFSKRTIFIVGTGVLIIGAVLSVRVCTRWSDAATLWHTTFHDHPRSPRAGATVVLLELQAKHSLLSPSEFDGYSQVLDNVERLNPTLPELWLARAGLYRAIGKDDLAKQALSRAEEFRPGISMRSQLTTTFSDSLP